MIVSLVATGLRVDLVFWETHQIAPQTVATNRITQGAGLTSLRLRFLAGASDMIGFRLGYLDGWVARAIWLTPARPSTSSTSMMS
jgi:hypothetical protein